MSQKYSFCFLLSIYLIILPSFSSTNNPSYTSFITSACNTTRYTTLCLKTCLPYASKIAGDPRKLATVSLSSALTTANATTSSLAGLSRRKNLAGYEAGVVQDCMDNVGDTIDDIKKSIKEVNDLGKYSFSSKMNKFKVSNIQTYMSAALTNENTCMDEIGEGKVSPLVKSKIKRNVLLLSRLVSNALALCNRLQT